MIAAAPLAEGSPVLVSFLPAFNEQKKFWNLLRPRLNYKIETS
jgi:hypothetical protein